MLEGGKGFHRGIHSSKRAIIYDYGGGGASSVGDMLEGGTGGADSHAA
jgi:hypothetical protein